MVRSDGVSWLISSGGAGGWEVLQTTTEPLDGGGAVAVGDFDGDGYADVFRATGTAWEMSSGGTEPFIGWSHGILPKCSKYSRQRRNNNMCISGVTSCWTTLVQCSISPRRRWRIFC